MLSTNLLFLKRNLLLILLIKILFYYFRKLSRIEMKNENDFEESFKELKIKFIPWCPIPPLGQVAFQSLVQPPDRPVIFLLKKVRVRKRQKEIWRAKMMVRTKINWFLHAIKFFRPITPGQKIFKKSPSKKNHEIK